MEKFRGVYAIPQIAFTEEGAVNFEETAQCVSFLMECKVHGVVVPVYASESSTLLVDERNRILKETIAVVDKRVPIIAGIASERIQTVLSLAESACELGADAVIAYNPTTLSSEEVVTFFKEIDSVINVPLVIQNLGPAFGGKSMSSDTMIRIIEQSKNLCYVKEEGADFLAVMKEMTDYEQQNPERLLGVMGGQGCRSIFEEYRRGACGTMPPSYAADVMVDIWNLLDEGKESEAYAIHQQIMSLLLFAGNNKLPSYKEILRRRGVLSNTVCRPRNWPALTSDVLADLDFIMEQVSHLFSVEW